MDKKKSAPLFQRNLITAFKRSKLAQTVLTTALVFTAGCFLLSWRSSLLKQEEALAARRQFNAKFSADDFLKYQGGDVKLPPDNHGLIRYISNQIAGPSRIKLNLTDTKKTDYSEAGQPKFVDKLLGGKTDGFYVECGAYDGEKKSKTLFFEKERGWEGFLIEANPLSYRRLMQKRRKAFSINACLNPTNQAKVMTFKPVGLVGGLVHGMDQKHIDAIQKHPEYSRDVDIQCYPLYSIMKALGPLHVDFLSLNIHGAELDVLKTIPFEKLTIDVLAVEYRIARPDKRTDVRASIDKLNKIRKFIESTGLYEEKGILPAKPGEVKREIEATGVDVIFKRKPEMEPEDYQIEDNEIEDTEEEDVEE